MAVAVRALCVACFALLAPGCDDGETATGAGGAGGAPSATGVTSATGGTSTDGSQASTTAPSGSTSTGMMQTFVGRCGEPTPQGAAEPDPAPAYSGGTCPALAAGTNTIASGGADRAFILVLPADYDPMNTYPVFFLWHWLGGSADDFLQRAEVQLAADTQQFIAVIPEKKGDVLFTWPVENFQSQARVDEELGFFDDMLSCVFEQFSEDAACVTSTGVSAGALWTDQLASARSTLLSSFVSLSGGTGGVIRPWATAEHRLPGLVLWGGDTDTCQGLLSFKTLSNDLETHLTADGHFFLECIHNCGHSQPPFEGPAGYSTFKGMWDFMLDHPYWVTAGDSIYETEGLSPDLPEWCAIGQGNAEERVGECLDPSEC